MLPEVFIKKLAQTINLCEEPNRELPLMKKSFTLRQPLFAITILLTMAIVSVACGSSDPEPTPTPAPTPTPELPAGSVLHRIDLKTGIAVDLTIKVGESVLWTNVEEGFVLHSSINHNPERGGKTHWLGPNMNPGEHFRHTFNEPGEFLWLCRSHPSTERGFITVVSE